MVKPKAAGKDFTVEHKPTRRKTLPPINVEEVKRRVAPLIATVPSHTPVAEIIPPGKLETGFQFVEAVDRLTDHGEAAFVEAGRLLNQAKEALGHGRFMAEVETRVKVGQRRANMLMAAAEVIDSGMIPAGQAPSGYSVLAAMKPILEIGVDRAAEANILRPDVTRQEVATFVRQARPPRRETDPRKRLEAELRRLNETAERIERRREEIRRLLA